MVPSRAFSYALAALCAVLLAFAESPTSAQVIDDFEQGSFQLGGTTFDSGVQQFLLPIHCITPERVDRMFINGNPSGADLNLGMVDDEVTTVWGDGGGRLEFDYELAAPVDLSFGGTQNALRVNLTVAVPAGRVEVTLRDSGGGGASSTVGRTIGGPGAYSIALSEFVGVDTGDVRLIRLALDVPDFGDYHIADFRAWYDPSIAAGMDVLSGPVVGPPYPTEGLRIATYGMDADGTTVQTEILSLSLAGVTNAGSIPEVEMTAGDSGGGIGGLGEQGIIVIDGATGPTEAGHFRTVALRVDLLPGPALSPILAFPPSFVIDPTMRGAALHFATYARDRSGDTAFRHDYYFGFETPEGSGLEIAGMGVEPQPFFGDSFFDVVVEIDATAPSVSDKRQQGLLNVQMNVVSFGFAAATSVPGFAGRGSLTLWAQPSVMGASTQLWLSRTLEKDTSLRLFDLAGRAVRTLVIPAGRPFAVWDGRDSHGEDVASGTYFARVLGRPDAAVGKLVVLR